MTKQSLPGIQVGRGIAATMVVVAHSEMVAAAHLGGGVFGQTGLAGQAGVDFFFVLSGFIMTWAHGGDFGRPERLREYAARRFMRLYPPYWAALALLLLGGAIGLGGQLPAVERIAANALLLPDPDGALLAVAWTLPFEIIFYALVGLAIWRKGIGLFALAAWFVVGATLEVDGIWGFYLVTDYVWHFALGMAAAMYVRRLGCQSPGLTIAAGLTVFGLAIARNHAATYGQLDFAMASALIVVGLATLQVRWPRPALFLGNASYAIYLAHFPAMALFVRFVGGGWLTQLLSIAAGIGAGVAFHYLVERRIAFHPAGIPLSRAA